MPFIRTRIRPGAQQRVPALVVSGLVLPLGVLAACGSDEGPASAAGSSRDEVTVLATTSIWADVVARVACVEGVAVRSMVPNGADAHAFEPTLADREQLDRAALVVANGLLLEEGLADSLEAAETGGTPVFRVADHVTTIAYGAGHEEEDDHDDEDDHDEDEDDDDDGDEDEDDHGHDGDDPHVWQDPQRVAAVVPELAAALIATGLEAEAVEGCADVYVAELEELDTEVEMALSEIPPGRRLLVTSHDSMGYFADRYGFEVIGTVSPSSSGLAEPNPADLERLVATIETTGVPAIFVEPQKADGDARAVAERVEGVAVVGLFTDSLGPQGSGAETYVGLVRTNAQVIAEALSGR